jgi:hypothetical protein
MPNLLRQSARVMCLLDTYQFLVVCRMLSAAIVSDQREELLKTMLVRCQWTLTIACGKLG